MFQTIFTIPVDIGSTPLFGFGILLAVWAVVCAVWLTLLVQRHGWQRETLSYLPVWAIVAVAIFFAPQIFPDGLKIRGYGVMLLLGVVSGIGLAAHRARRMGVDPEVIFSLAFWMFLAGIVGARFFYVVQKWDTEYQKDSWGETLGAIVNVPQGGLVVYGALIGALAAFCFFMWKHRLPGLAMADLIAPSLALGLALGRIGCLANGCCHGQLCELPWAVTFPEHTPPFQNHVQRGDFYGLQLSSGDDAVRVEGVAEGSLAEQSGLKAGMQIESINGQPVKTTRQAAQLLSDALFALKPLRLQLDDNREAVVPVIDPVPKSSLPVHPSQIYSAIHALLLCLFLLAYYPYRRRDGEVVAMTLTIYPIARFLLEQIRSDELSFWGTGLTVSQNVSIVMLLGVALPLWILLSRGPRKLALPAVSPQ